MMYPLASKHYSSNEFPVLAPTVKSISHWDKVGTGPPDSQSSPEMRLRSAIDRNTVMQFAGMSDPPQRPKGAAHWAKGLQCVPLWDPATIACKPRQTDTLQQHEAEVLGKQASPTGKPKHPVNLKEGSLWLRGVYDGELQLLLSPHNGHHIALQEE